MTFALATKQDVETLVQLRLDYLLADLGALTPEESAALQEALPGYFEKHLDQGFLAVIAKQDGCLAGGAFMVMSSRPPSPAMPNGCVGLILNVLTYPSFRRQGVGTRMLTRLMQEAKQNGACRVELSATQEGQKLYESMGFLVSKYPAMYKMLL